MPPDHSQGPRAPASCSGRGTEASLKHWTHPGTSGPGWAGAKGQATLGPQGHCQASPGTAPLVPSLSFQLRDRGSGSWGVQLNLLQSPPSPWGQADALSSSAPCPSVSHLESSPPQTVPSPQAHLLQEGLRTSGPLPGPSTEPLSLTGPGGESHARPTKDSEACGRNRLQLSVCPPPTRLGEMRSPVMPMVNTCKRSHVGRSALSRKLSCLRGP